MNHKAATRIYLLPIITLGLLTATIPSNFADQPKSTITTTGKYYTPFQGATPITLSTNEVPTPDCPSDPPDADPDWYWDFGPDLDGTNNNDGVYGDDGVADTPDTATIKTDKAGTYNVTVYCMQTFYSLKNGSDYMNSTTADTTK